ncbi:MULTISPECIES: hypothetical protein [Flavobacterium]|uniref:Uncharacterized protein n=1 Tax=Flavobacterium salmonis TaxID=2654844 RepID=A0A6V6Z610_9FLAO|nr:MULTISPECIES: hypothetical protein [Flavobacterium]OOV17598.1 hypothetical protein BXU10_16100 [Flavobacterium sp. LM4]CAD0007221.1 hypothetical protein FLAT13_03716 [Flavobacterium salmonis]
MITQTTIKGQIQMARRRKIIAAVHFFFRYKDFLGNKKENAIKQDTNVFSGMNYYFEQENWVFRERARHNSTLFFTEVLQTLNNAQSTTEQKLEQLVLKYVELLFEKPDFAAYLIANKTDLSLFCYQNRLEFMAIKKMITLYSFNPFPVVISLIGMLLLPLAMTISPEDNQFSQVNEFDELIEDRKKLLPLWIHFASL